MLCPLLPHVYLSLWYNGLVRPSWTGGGGGNNTPLDGLPSNLALPTVSYLPSSTMHPALAKAFVVGPGYIPVPNKLVTKITSGMFIELADLLAENIKLQEIECQAFLEGKLSGWWKYRHFVLGRGLHHLLLDTVPVFPNEMDTPESVQTINYSDGQRFSWSRMAAL